MRSQTAQIASVSVVLCLALPYSSDAQTSRRQAADIVPKMKVFSSGESSGVIEKIRTQAPGTIVRVHVTKGQQVRRGTLLAELDSDNHRHQLEIARQNMEARGNVRRLESILAARRSELNDAEEQFRKRTITRNRLSQVENMVDAAQAELDMALEAKKIAQANYEHALDQYEKRFIRSPVDGVVEEVLVTEGQPVGYAAHVCTVANPQAAIFTVSVPAELAEALRQLDSVLVRRSGQKEFINASILNMTEDPASPGVNQLLTIIVNSAHDSPNSASPGKYDLLVLDSQAKPSSEEAEKSATE